ncbi:hypothetical protein [Pseudoflavonifractor phocaeensis]|uniref:hypothetical protein n=1 Tax=Pseudoflavonifractor phocaeensis TaxID=1870988 RepID=UPI00195D6358|nr:hypothetical protein [Pseudoflavonifractor phocaeensis]
MNLSNNTELSWTYSADADAWVMSIVSAVAYPELPDQQGVSVCVPGAYVTGIDTDGDGDADVTGVSAGEEAVSGSLVIDYEAEITSTNGQTYTAATAPVILNTGAAGYGSQNNSLASATYAADGYIHVSCGNRGKQDTATDEDGNTYYTGDAPSCLVDQKNAARFVKYNILLGNLPGSVDYMVSTGGSGGGAHAVMFAATSNNPDFYDYEIDAGAVGVYYTEDGGYSTAVTIDGTEVEISDGAWGCVGYSAITSLAESDMTLAFEYYLDADYDFSTEFQAQLAEYLSQAYMEYINEQDLSVCEADVGFDLNGDGDLEDTIALTIEYDPEAYPETNGYYGTYLELYLAEFTQNLQWYVDNLDYAEGWTWFDGDGNALSDEEVATMTSEDKAEAFLEGRYAKGASSNGPGDMLGGRGDGMGDLPDGNLPDGELPADMEHGQMGRNTGDGNREMIVGTPDASTTQAAGSAVDSNNYATYEEMVAAYRADIESIQAGDEYGNNLAELYDPLNYINAEGTENPTWVKILCGAAEGDISMFNSLNLHVDQMYGAYVEGTAVISKAAAQPQTTNGTATEATGTDLTSWVSLTDGQISFSLADTAAYRTAGASKAMPAFDVIDYGQEDYVFGTAEQDARHWDPILLDIFETHSDVLAPLFNSGNAG